MWRSPPIKLRVKVRVTGWGGHKRICKCTSKRVKVQMIMSSRIEIEVRMRSGLSESVRLTIRDERRVCHADAYAIYRLALLSAQAQRAASLHDTLREYGPEIQCYRIAIESAQRQTSNQRTYNQKESYQVSCDQLIQQTLVVKCCNFSSQTPANSGGSLSCTCRTQPRNPMDMKWPEMTRCHVS